VNEQELNRKLAEWAGFTYIKHYVPSYGYTEENDPDPLYVELWSNPNAEPVDLHWDFGMSNFEPNFTQSLDACFKWLVPKLKQEGLMITVNMLGSISEKWDCRLHKGYFPNIAICLEEAEIPALALCLAIEKLIGQGTE